MIDERYGFPPDFDFRDIEDENQIQYGPNGEMLSGAAAITTGATDAQIEAAAERWHDYLLYQNSTTRWDEQSVDIQSYWCAAMNKMAMALVTTEERIVRVDDLRALIEHTVWRDDDHEGHAALSRIVDLIGEAE